MFVSRLATFRPYTTSATSSTLSTHPRKPLRYTSHPFAAPACTTLVEGRLLGVSDTTAAPAMVAAEVETAAAAAGSLLLGTVVGALVPLLLDLLGFAVADVDGVLPARMRVEAAVPLTVLSIWVSLTRMAGLLALDASASSDLCRRLSSWTSAAFG